MCLCVWISVYTCIRVCVYIWNVHVECHWHLSDCHCSYENIQQGHFIMYTQSLFNISLNLLEFLKKSNILWLQISNQEWSIHIIQMCYTPLLMLIINYCHLTNQNSHSMIHLLTTFLKCNTVNITLIWN